MTLATDSELSVRPAASRRLNAAAGIMLVLAVLITGVFFARRAGSDYRTYSNDFNVYYFAAVEVLAGHDPYQNRLGPWTPYLYPPLLAEAMVPMALLPLPIAAYIWFLISAVALGISAKMSASLAENLVNGCQASFRPSLSHESTKRTYLILCVSTLAVSSLVWDCFRMGQVNAVVAALAIAHVYHYYKKKPAASALMLALAVALKLTPGVILLYHIVKGRIRFSLGCVLLILLFGLGGFLPFGSRALPAARTFWTQTVQNGQGFDMSYTGNQSVRAFTARLEGQHDEPARRPSEPLSTAIALMLIGISLFAARKEKTDLASVGVFFCLSPMLSPLSWKGHYLILIFPIAIWAASIASSRKHRTHILSIACFIAMAFILNLTGPNIIGQAAAEAANSVSLFVIAAVMIFAANIRTAAFDTNPSGK